MKHLRPLSNRVLVELIENEGKTIGGIIIPDTAKEKPRQGIVLVVGPGERCPKTGNYMPMDVKVHDVVVFGKYSGDEVTLGDTKYLVLKESEIMCTVEEKSSSQRAA